ncbi:hypothetical protein WJX75_005853 [Coccomyxa subellipsoidea]|uniref:Uncharacterized protein n=1 Tax=Coccomyxa subellipsoidea TaxID=248742 RepID=A0ABR2YBN4_9CHLO
MVAVFEGDERAWSPNADHGGEYDARITNSADASTSGQDTSTAAYYGQTAVLLSLLKGLPPEELGNPDSQGNTVPLLWTVYALVSFRNFHALPTEGESAQDSFFMAPEGYRLKALHQSLSKDKKKKQRPSLSDGPLADFEEDDLLI